MSGEYNRIEFGPVGLILLTAILVLLLFRGISGADAAAADDPVLQLKPEADHYFLG